MIVIVIRAGELILNTSQQFFLPFHVYYVFLKLIGSNHFYRMKKRKRVKGPEDWTCTKCYRVLNEFVTYKF